MVVSLYFPKLSRDGKRLLTYCKFILCKSQRAKWIISFLMLYVLGTVFYVKQYVFNQRDPSFEFCENTNEHQILIERSNFDKILYHRLLNQPSKVSEEANDFIDAYDHIFIYSAFLDDRKPPTEIRTRYYVKIVSILLKDLSQHYLPEPKCHLKFRDEVVSNESAIVIHIPEDHSCCYTAAFILCPVTKSSIPTDVAVTIGKSQPRWLSVQSRLKKSVSNSEIAVCVRPFYGKEFSIMQLAEFISYHHNIGVNHFQFYNIAAPVQVKDFLNVLKIGVPFSISLLQWSVPLKKFLVHEWGQLAFIQDCILRWQSRVEYVAILDLDELIMPQTTHTLKTTLLQLKSDFPSASAFVLPSVIFCEEYLPKIRNNSDLMPFVSLYSDKRQTTPWPHHIRSKYIVLPSRVLVTGIHFVWKSVDQFWPVNVPADQVTIYHYRTCCNVHQPWLFGYMFFSVFADAVHTDKKVTDMAATIMECPVYKTVQRILHLK